MNALIINGSPRPVGSCGLLCEELARGVIQKGGSAEIVHLSEANVQHCRGCMSCFQNKACVVQDGMAEIIEKILACDVLVLASPSYWGYVTAQMKTFIDRSLPLCEHVAKRKIGEGKLGVSIAVRAGSGREENRELVQCFEHYFGHLGIEPYRALTFENVSSPEALTDATLQEAFQLGEEIGEKSNLEQSKESLRPSEDPGLPPAMDTIIHQRVKSAQAGENPYVVCRVKSGWVVLGDHQFLEGYCLLLPDPVVESLNELTTSDRSRFLSDMAAVGDALLEVTDAHRINYEILGNLDPALHAHIFPRYIDEPPDKKLGPVWHYDRSERRSVPFDARIHRPLMEKMRAYLMTNGTALPDGAQ